jgi:hypothetical protein
MRETAYSPSRLRTNAHGARHKDGCSDLVKSLRPALGHPNNASALAELVAKEETLTARARDLLAERHSAVRASVERVAPVAAERMASLRQSFFDVCEGFVHEADVAIDADVQAATKKSLKALLKDHVFGDTSAPTAAGGSKADDKTAASYRRAPEETSWPSVEILDAVVAPATCPNTETNRAIHAVYTSHATSLASHVAQRAERNNAKHDTMSSAVERAHREWLVSIDSVKAPYAGAVPLAN